MRRHDEGTHFRPCRHGFHRRCKHFAVRAIIARVLAKREILLREHRPLDDQELAEVGQGEQPVLHLVVVGVGYEG